jgi:hypothetical protein
MCTSEGGRRRTKLSLQDSEHFLVLKFSVAAIFLHFYVEMIVALLNVQGLLKLLFNDL